MQTGRLKNYALRTLQGALGPQNVERIRLARNFNHYTRHQIIFIHIPKNAGSSVSRALYGGSLGHWRAEALRVYAPEKFQSLPSFALLRDPVERAFSAWNYCRSAGTSEGWVKDRPEYHLPEFETFECFATQWLPSRNPDELDFVFQSQSRFVTDKSGDVLVSRLVHLADLKAAWPDLIKDANPVSQSIGERNKNKSKQADGLANISQEARVSIETIYAKDMTLIAKVGS